VEICKVRWTLSVAVSLVIAAFAGCRPPPECPPGEARQIVEWQIPVHTWVLGVNIEPFDPSSPKVACYMQGDDKVGDARLSYVPIEYNTNTRQFGKLLPDPNSIPDLIVDWRRIGESFLLYRIFTNCVSVDQTFVDPIAVRALWIAPDTGRIDFTQEITPNFHHDTDLIEGNNHYLCILNVSNIPVSVSFAYYEPIFGCVSGGRPSPLYRPPLPGAGAAETCAAVTVPNPGCPDPEDTFGLQVFCSTCDGSWVEKTTKELNNYCTSVAREIAQEDAVSCTLTDGPCTE
jgi:hypothetical protein